MLDVGDAYTIRNWIVCGWYTLDYLTWAERLAASLDKHGLPYSLAQAQKVPGSWEANTMAKPAQLLAAMDRHPGNTIVFLDVDCEVRAPLDDLVANVSGDVAFYVRVKRRRSGQVKWGSIRSGTMVVRPTLGARTFVERWALEGRDARYGDVDQDTLMLALGRTPWVSFTALPVEYCATAGDKCAAPVIFHDSASADVRKITKRDRWLKRSRAWLQGLTPSALP